MRANLVSPSSSQLSYAIREIVGFGEIVRHHGVEDSVMPSGLLPTTRNGTGGARQPTLLPRAEHRLTTRQKHVLALVLESGLAGPSLVAKELGVGLSTAYRDLASLEEAGLITADAGKRTLTAAGLSYLGDLTHRF